MTQSVTDLTGRRLQAMVAKEQSSARLPSLVAGVVRDGALVWSGTHGGQTGGIPPSSDTQYRIGSITKTLTAVLIMQLRDEGKLDLGDRVDVHLPGIGYGDRTIRTLLSHTSGMQSEPVGSWWERSPGRTFDELAAAIDDSQGPFPVGHTFHYTNLAFGLLGEVVARLRGSTWWDQVEQRILQPLAMHRTSYLSRPPAATGYSVHQFAGTLSEEPSPDTGAMAPAGQVWSTVEDLARYACFLVGGHDEVLSSATLDEMTIPQTGWLGAGSSGGYGLGLFLLADGPRTVAGHGGSMPGFLAGIFVDRVRRTGAMCLTNGTHGLRSEGLPLDLLSALEELEPTIVDAWTPTEDVPTSVAEILGLWHWGNTAHTFAFDGARVVVRRLGAVEPSHTFRASDDGAFVGTSGYHHGETMRIVRNEDDSINHLVCATFIYTRVPYDPAAPIPEG